MEVISPLKLDITLNSQIIHNLIFCEFYDRNHYGVIGNFQESSWSHWEDHWDHHGFIRNIMWSLRWSWSHDGFIRSYHVVMRWCWSHQEHHVVIEILMESSGIIGSFMSHQQSSASSWSHPESLEASSRPSGCGHHKSYWIFTHLCIFHLFPALCHI